MPGSNRAVGFGGRGQALFFTETDSNPRGWITGWLAVNLRGSKLAARLKLGGCEPDGVAHTTKQQLI